MTRAVLASGNPGKLREMAALLAPAGFELRSQAEFGIEPPPETGDTFLANALIKARYAAQVAQIPAIADDSGIEVDALDGRPGVYSARYAGEHATDRDNLEKMLLELRDVPAGQRTARYRCVIVMVRSATDASPVVGHGSWEGHVIAAPRGSGGFGYDPIFVPLGMDYTVAEMSPAQKNAVSHRALAMAALLRALG